MDKSENKKIRKAVLAAAGFGTRFLPQTKSMPKEMLPLVDKPIIHYVVEELVDAGIEDIIIVTGYHKRAIEDYFDAPSSDLRQNLLGGGKKDQLESIEKISELANFAYIRQKGPYGNATPLLNAEHLIGGEPFIYAYADDFVKASPSRFKQLVGIRQQHGGCVLTCIRAQDESDYKKYGFVGGNMVNESLMDVQTIIEKPGTKENAPSNFATVSGYVLDPAIFSYLQRDLSELQGDREFIFQPALQRMINDGHKIYGYEAPGGKFYDTGSKLGYLKTVVEFALEHGQMGKTFRQYLRGLRF